METRWAILSVCLFVSQISGNLSPKSLARHDKVHNKSPKLLHTSKLFASSCCCFPWICSRFRLNFSRLVVTSFKLNSLQNKTKQNKTHHHLTCKLDFEPKITSLFTRGQSYCVCVCVYVDPRTRLFACDLPLAYDSSSLVSVSGRFNIPFRDNVTCLLMHQRNSICCLKIVRLVIKIGPFNNSECCCFVNSRIILVSSQICWACRIKDQQYCPQCKDNGTLINNAPRWSWWWSYFVVCHCNAMQHNKQQQDSLLQNNCLLDKISFSSIQK